MNFKTEYIICYSLFHKKIPRQPATGEFFFNFHFVSLL
jgi:hypothetical protein